MAGEWYCPKCDDELEVVGEYPDTGTDTDFYEMGCENGHTYILISNRQTGEGTLRESSPNCSGKLEDDVHDSDVKRRYLDLVNLLANTELTEGNYKKIKVFLEDL